MGPVRTEPASSAQVRHKERAYFNLTRLVPGCGRDSAHSMRFTLLIPRDRVDEILGSLDRHQLLLLCFVLISVSLKCKSRVHVLLLTAHGDGFKGTSMSLGSPNR